MPNLKEVFRCLGMKLSWRQITKGGSDAACVVSITIGKT